MKKIIIFSLCALNIWGLDKTSNVFNSQGVDLVKKGISELQDAETLEDKFAIIRQLMLSLGVNSASMIGTQDIAAAVCAMPQVLRKIE